MPTTNEQYGRMTAPGQIVIERLLPGPIGRVWAYLTESDKRATWIAAGDMDLRAGGSYEYIFDHDVLSETKEETPEKYKDECYSGMKMGGRIIAVSPPNLLHMTWPESGAEGGADESEVKFELAEVDGKVKLTLTHLKLFDNDLLVGVSAGWHAHVAIMIDVIEGKSPRAFWSNHMVLEGEYRKKLFP